MRTTFLVCMTLLATGCSGGGKPTEAPNEDSTASPESSVTTPSANATAAPAPIPTSTGNPSGSCGGRTCAAGQICRSYYGVAGPRGPLFHECVIPCRRGAHNDGCPSGSRCYTIADGPGDVCQ